MEKITVEKNSMQPLKKDDTASSSTMYKVLFILPVTLILLGILNGTPKQLLKGLYLIVKMQDVLLIDYLMVGGLGATLLNAGLCTLFNLCLVRHLKLKPNGSIISAIFLSAGFSFMGKNIVNILPFYLGGFLYSKYHGIEYKKVVVINMLSTTLAPLTMVIVKNIPTSFLFSFSIGVAVSTVIGFIMPTISAHALTIHAGYSIYNMGFAAGFVAIVIYSVLSALGFEVERNNIVSTEFQWLLMWFILGFSLVCIGIGYYLNHKSFKGLGEVFTHTGRVVTDMVHHVDFPLTLVNMGLLGIMGTVYVYFLGGNFNGPTICALLTLIGFGAFGKHLKNTLPILIGVVIAAWLYPVQPSITTIVITGLFGTTLAPIAGEYGPLIGMLVGMVHFALTLNISSLHGGIHLYNNGLSGGIIATLFIPLLNAFRKEKS
jgi:hypothetical protein